MSQLCTSKCANKNQVRIRCVLYTHKNSWSQHFMIDVNDKRSTSDMGDNSMLSYWWQKILLNNYKKHLLQRLISICLISNSNKYECCKIKKKIQNFGFGLFWIDLVGQLKLLIDQKNPLKNPNDHHKKWSRVRNLFFINVWWLNM